MSFSRLIFSTVGKEGIVLGNTCVVFGEHGIVVRAVLTFREGDHGGSCDGARISAAFSHVLVRQHFVGAHYTGKQNLVRVGVICIAQTGKVYAQYAKLDVLEIAGHHIGRVGGVVIHNHAGRFGGHVLASEEDRNGLGLVVQPGGAGLGKLRLRVDSLGSLVAGGHCYKGRSGNKQILFHNDKMIIGYKYYALGSCSSLSASGSIWKLPEASQLDMETVIITSWRP